MEYCLCIKPGDKNLLHIVKKSHLSKDVFRSYKVVSTAKTERDAYEAAADLVRGFCDTGHQITSEGFKAWIAGDKL